MPRARRAEDGGEASVRSRRAGPTGRQPPVQRMETRMFRQRARGEGANRLALHPGDGDAEHVVELIHGAGAAALGAAPEAFGMHAAAGRVWLWLEPALGRVAGGAGHTHTHVKVSDRPLPPCDTVRNRRSVPGTCVLCPCFAVRRRTIRRGTQRQLEQHGQPSGAATGATQWRGHLARHNPCRRLTLNQPAGLLPPFPSGSIVTSPIAGLFAGGS